MQTDIDLERGEQLARLQPTPPSKRSWLLWLWLFPLPQIAFVLSHRPLYPLPRRALTPGAPPPGHSPFPRYTYRWWPFGRYHVACGTRILHPPSRPEPSPHVIDHELHHLWQQEQQGGIWFLLDYAFGWMENFFFHPDYRFQAYRAYRGMWQEQDAYLVGQVAKMHYRSQQFQASIMGTAKAETRE